MSALKICPQCSTEYPANERFCPRDGTALRSQGGDSDLVGSVIADRYHVLKKLGEGGMGQVYLAEHVKMGRKSAVKVMHPGMVSDVDAISRFNREAANASRINHPNVAGIYDFGETPEGVIYLAMEFIEGQSLTSLVAQNGTLAPVRAAEIARQTADGLSIAHDMGIVHRDLKPDNIMIARTRDGGDLVKVVDFGIAKAAGSEGQNVTKTGLVVGTPEYMSPEQLAGDKLDGRSDIYSLGLVTFNMLTGKLPFPSESMQETMIMRLTDKPKPLAFMKPDVAWPADVQAVMDKVLERDATLRYQTAAEFGRDLFRVIERMPATRMVEMGTQVMGQVGAAKTAVVGAAGAGATAAIGAVPATRVASAADLTPAPAPARAPAGGGGKKWIPIGVGVAVVLIAGALVAPKLMNHAPPAAVVSPDSQHQGSPPNPGKGSATPGAGASSPAPTNGGSVPVPSGHNSAADRPTSNFDADFKRVDALTDISEGGDSITAHTALQQLAALKQKVKTHADSLGVDFYRAEANLLLGTQTTACAILQDIISRGGADSASTMYVKRATSVHSSTC